MGLEKDLPPGEQLVTLFRPFLEHLAASNLSPKTIQKHVDNMWVLGGEFIRDLHNDPPLRKRPVDQVLSKMIEYGGPLLYHGGEDQQRSFDSTCRKFRRFLTERLPADARRHPQIPPTRLLSKCFACLFVFPFLKSRYGAAPRAGDGIEMPISWIRPTKTRYPRRVSAFASNLRSSRWTIS